MFSGFMDGSGTLNGQGYDGFWWSSTSIGSSSAFALLAYTNGFVYPGNGGSRGDGWSVRCLVPGS